MATIGIAFALGFILGPAMGGLLSMIDLTAYYPALKEYGVNPFSMPAFWHLFYRLSTSFIWRENLKKLFLQKKRGQSENQRVTNPLKLLSHFPIRELTLPILVISFSWQLFLVWNLP